MSAFDLPLDQLRAFRPPRSEPDDFDAFWADTLAGSRAAAAPPRFDRVDDAAPDRHASTTSRSAASPASRSRAGSSPRPGPPDRCRRSSSTSATAAAGRCRSSGSSGRPPGYAHFVMDTRGQGSTWSPGATPDIVSGLGADGPAGGHHPGFVTRGVESPATWYYRRLVTDAVLALDAVAAHPLVDAGADRGHRRQPGRRARAAPRPGLSARRPGGRDRRAVPVLLATGGRDHRRRPVRRAAALPLDPPRAGGGRLPDALVRRRPELRRPGDRAGAVLGRAHGRRSVRPRRSSPRTTTTPARRTSASGRSTATRPASRSSNPSATRSSRGPAVRSWLERESFPGRIDAAGRAAYHSPHPRPACAADRFRAISSPECVPRALS